MRFKPRAPLERIKLEYDIVISQNFGRAIDSWRARTQPNGGSELHTVVIAEGLQKAGFRVAVIQPGPSFVRWANVDYLSLEDVIHRGLYDIQCEVLCSQRFGSLPANVSFAHLAVEMHDLPDERAQTCIDFMSQIPGCKTILHSQFNSNLYPDWPGSTIIPAAFEDSLYDMQAPPLQSDKRERTFVYGSAALKGLIPTLMLWGELKRNHYAFKKATLIVTSPGYDAPEFDKLKETPGVVYEQQKTLGDMIMRIANSDGLFQFNALPETFGCVHVMAEIVKRPAWIICSDQGPGALREVLANPWTIHTNPKEFVEAVAERDWPEIAPAHDYRMSKLLPQWLDVLGLTQPKEQYDIQRHVATDREETVRTTDETRRSQQAIV